MCILLAGLSPAALHAQTLSWGTSVVESTPVIFDADGSASSPSHTWTTGWFNDGFVPAADNFDLWLKNYNIMDTAVPLNGGGIFDEYGVSGSATYSSDSPAIGRQAYILAFNDPEAIGTPEGQALLLRQDGLLFPSTGNSATFDIADNSLSASDDAFTVIWGRVDRNYDAPGGILHGGGVLANPLPDNAFEAQFASWAAKPDPDSHEVPDNGSTALYLLGSFAAVTRLLKHRRNK